MSHSKYQCRFLGFCMMMLLCFVTTIHGDSEGKHPFTHYKQQQHFTLFQSLVSLNTTSIILPIAYVHNQWIISSLSPTICTDTVHTAPNHVPLSILLHHVSTTHLPIRTIKLHIISLTNTTMEHIRILSQMITNPQYNIHISELIIPSSPNTQIPQIMSQSDIQITTYFHTPTISHAQKRQLLLINRTHNITHAVIPKESWVCDPWPIYVGFFCGIGVTVLVNIAIRFSMGDQDRELMNALEKVVTTGISNDPFDEFDPNKDDGFPEINLFAFTRHRSHRSVSQHVTTPRTGRDRVRSRARSLQMRQNRKQVASLSLDQFNQSINNSRNNSMDYNGHEHRRKVTFADEMRRSQKLEDTLAGLELEADNSEPDVTLRLPPIATRLACIPSSVEISPADEGIDIMFNEAVANLKGTNDSFPESNDSLSSLIEEKEMEAPVVEEEEEMIVNMPPINEMPPMATLQHVLSDSASDVHEVDAVVDFIQNEVIACPDTDITEVIYSEEEMA